MAKFLNDGAAQAMDDRNRADAKPEGKANNNNFCILCSLFVYCYALKSYHIVQFKGYFNEIVVSLLVQARNMCKIFFFLPSKKQEKEKTETNQVFTFQFLSDKIDQNTNFAKLPSAKWLFLV